MQQFEMYFTNEYLKELVAELADAMGLPFEEAEAERAVRERDTKSSNNILFVKKGQCFICVDCNNRDWIFPLVARCDESQAGKVKEIMMKWDKLIREEYAQESTGDMLDVYGADDNLFKKIERYYHISL